MWQCVLGIFNIVPFSMAWSLATRSCWKSHREDVIFHMKLVIGSVPVILYNYVDVFSGALVSGC